MGNLVHTFTPCHFQTQFHNLLLCCFSTVFTVLKVTKVFHTRPKWIAGEKWISRHLKWTEADWYMIHSFTLSTNTTCSSTWIFTFIIDAGTVVRTVSVENTLWPTCQVRVTKVFWFAHTY